ncbi:hypothetical protein K4K55_012932, partial [Colletotrichum sp. SAR 10_96]
MAETRNAEGEEKDASASEDEISNTSLHVRPHGPGTAPDSADEAGPDHPDVKAGTIPEWSRPLSPWSFAPLPPDKSKRMRGDAKAVLDATNQTKQQWYLGFPPNMAARRKDYVAKGKYIKRNWTPRGALEGKRKELIGLYRKAGADLKQRPFEHMLSGSRVLMEKDTFTKARSNFVLPYLGLGEPHELIEFLDTSVARIAQNFLHPFTVLAIEGPYSEKGPLKNGNPQIAGLPSAKAVFDCVKRLGKSTNSALKRSFTSPTTYPSEKKMTSGSDSVTWAGYFDPTASPEEGEEVLSKDRHFALLSAEMEQMIGGEEDEEREPESEEEAHERFRKDLAAFRGAELLRQYDEIYSSSLSAAEIKTLRQSIQADKQHEVFSLFQPDRKIKSNVKEKGPAAKATRLTTAEEDTLLGWAATYSNPQEVQGFRPISPNAGAKDLRLLAVSAGEGTETIRHAIAGSKAAESAEAGHNAGDGLGQQEEVTKQAESRKLMGGNLPQKTDLEAIVKEFTIAPPGATWDKLPISSSNPDFCLKPHQIVDANWLMEQAAQAIRAGIIASDCGIGKTLTSLYGLAEMKNRFKLANDGVAGVKYHPSAIIMPASVLDQTFKVAHELFSEHFQVHAFYQTAATAPKHRSRHTINNADELGFLMEKLKEKSDEPSSMDHLILMSYSTNNRRLMTGVAEPTLEDETEGVDSEDDEVEDRTKFDLPCELEFFGLIADEGHTIKNPQALAYIITEKMVRRFFWIMTATPTVSGVQDLKGYLSSMWDAAFGYETAESVGTELLDVIYSDEYVSAFRAQDKNAMTQLGVPFEGLMGLSEAAEAQARAAKTVAPELTASQKARREEYRLAMENGVPVYLLNPKNFQAYGVKRNWDVEFTSTAVKNALPLIQIRRGMLTPMVLPDGSTTCPGESMPACNIETIELAHVSSADIRALEALINGYSNDIWLPAEQNVKPTVGGSGDVDQHDKPKVNLAAMRNASLVSTDLRFASLVNPTRRLARATMDAAAASKLQSLGGASLGIQARKMKENEQARLDKLMAAQRGSGQELVGSVDDKPKTSSQHQREQRAKANLKAPAAGGVKEVNNVISKDVTNGLQYYYFATRTDPTIGCPADPITLARYIISKSPKLAWCLRHVLNLAREGKRCLLYTINPLTA